MPKRLRHGANNGNGSIDWNDAVHHVTLIANQMRPKLPLHVDLEDLVAEGLVGLMQAARKFDPKRNLKFRTYAEHRIRGAIFDSLRRLDQLSRDMRRKHREAENALTELTRTLNRPPTEEEISAYLTLPLARWRHLAQRLHDAGCPVNWHGLADKPATLVENLPARRGDPEAWAEREELRRMLNEAIRTLPPRYHEVVALYYGRDWTMKQIGRELGINESRVSQIHAAALSRMHAHLERTNAKMKEEKR